MSVCMSVCGVCGECVCSVCHVCASVCARVHVRMCVCVSCCLTFNNKCAHFSFSFM